MSIKLEHINYVYGEGTAYEKHALKDINLEIPDGQFVGIIGHTGSGKSTLIQHLNGLIKATSGEIYYNGENIYADGYSMKELRSHVGLVFLLRPEKSGASGRRSESKKSGSIASGRIKRKAL